jgi:hypothetical protein
MEPVPSMEPVFGTGELEGTVNRNLGNRPGTMEPGQVMESATSRKKRRKWPLLVMGAGASVTLWSGWVGLGKFTGFGEVHPLPGIWDSFHLNTAITLPVGMEAYAAYGVGVWLDRDNPARARRFACWSSIAALMLGMVGQVAYHELVAHQQRAAPGWLVAAVACLPVVVVAMAAILHHLQGEESAVVPDVPEPTPRPTALVVICTAALQPQSVTPPLPAEPHPAIEAPPTVPSTIGSMGVTEPAPPAGSHGTDGTGGKEPVPSPSTVRAPKRRPAGSGNRAPQVVGNRVVTLRDSATLLPKAIEINNAWRTAHGKDIGGGSLAERLGIHKSTALALLRQIKGTDPASGATSNDQAGG